MLTIRRSSPLDRHTPSRRLATRTALLVAAAAAAMALTVPAAGSAAVKPTLAERLEARSICAEQRGVTRWERRMFRRAYGVGKKRKRPFRRCIRIQARILARERAAEQPVLPGLPGIPELPGVRAQCQLEQAEDPIGFAQEYPGPDPVGLCTQLESMP